MGSLLTLSGDPLIKHEPLDPLERDRVSTRYSTKVQNLSLAFTTEYHQKQEQKKHGNNTKKVDYPSTLSLKSLSQLRSGVWISRNGMDVLHKCMGMLFNSRGDQQLQQAGWGVFTAPKTPNQPLLEICSFLEGTRPPIVTSINGIASNLAFRGLTGPRHVSCHVS